MEAILPILIAIVLIWLLSRINHEDNGQKANIMDEGASSGPSESEQAAVMLDEIDGERTGVTSKKESTEQQIPTINVKTKNIMENNEFEGMDNPTLVKTVLEKLNCHYDVDEDGNMFFSYQGESFWVGVSKKSYWIRIIDLQWYDCPLDNLELVSCIQKAINSANGVQQCTAYYVVNKEENKLSVFSKSDLLFSADFPNPVDFFEVWLSCFFRLKQKVSLEFEKEKANVGGTEQK